MTMGQTGATAHGARWDGNEEEEEEEDEEDEEREEEEEAEEEEQREAEGWEWDARLYRRLIDPNNWLRI